jgi:hypothetical protein
MAAEFDRLPSYAPNPVVRGESRLDPYDVVDEASEGIENSNQARKASTSAAGDIDWLPQNLKDRVDQHRPAPGDIDAKSGNVNKDRLTEEAEKLFGNIKKEMVFVNFYQLKQMLQRFAGYWGFVVSVGSSVCLVCFYTKSRSKPWEVTVSPRKQRGRTSMKTGCEFEIRVANHPILTKTEKRHRTPVRITKLHLKHGEQCCPGLTEQRMAKKSTGRIVGALELQKLDSSMIQIIANGNVSTQQLRSLLKDHIPPGYTITADDVRNIRVRCFKYSMEETPIDEEAAEKVVAFKPLDGGAITNNDDEDDDEDDDDNIAPADLDHRRKRPAGCDNGGTSKKSKKQKVPPVAVARQKMRQAFETLLDLSTGKNVDGEMSHTIYSSIIQLQDLTRGQNFDDVVEKADQKERAL